MLFMQEAKKQYQNHSKEKQTHLETLSNGIEISYSVKPIDLKNVEVEFEIVDENKDSVQEAITFKTFETDYWFNESSFLKIFELTIKKYISDVVDESLLEHLKNKYLPFEE